MKRLLILAPFLLWVGLPNLSFTAPPDRRYDFPIYTNNPPGRQLSGAHAPAVTVPLAPMESLQKIQVPQGFEVRLFAAEPDVANPVAMTWDERGRLWVLELYEYPKGAPGAGKAATASKFWRIPTPTEMLTRFPSLPRVIAWQRAWLWEMGEFIWRSLLISCSSKTPMEMIKRTKKRSC